MEPDDRVSVVILTHNRVDEVARTVEHVRALPERLPIVVVDNASTDHTPALLKERFPEIEIIGLSRNLGAAGRNAGVHAVTTPYVAFCDDDTWWAAAMSPACSWEAKRCSWPWIWPHMAGRLCTPRRSPSTTIPRRAAMPRGAGGFWPVTRSGSPGCGGLSSVRSGRRCACSVPHRGKERSAPVASSQYVGYPGSCATGASFPRRSRRCAGKSVAT